MTVNPQVLLPLIRRVMPSIIASDILGVSPLVAPTGKIYNMKSSWDGTLILTKLHYHHFLRVYNRKKYHTGDYLVNLGYQKASIRYTNVRDAREWCKAKLKSGSYLISLNDFWFAYDTDATLFIMRWS